MRTFRYDKLVRDMIVDQQREEGSKNEYRILEDAEYLQELKAKIIEEAKEMDTADKEELLSELADVQEAIDCILEAAGKSKEDLAKAQAKKNAKVGSFKKKNFIKTVTINEDNPWIQHYLKNPDRYPEITGE